MKKILTVLFLGIMAIAMIVGMAGADPWITDGSTATSRYNIVIGPGFNFGTSAAGTFTMYNGATVSANKNIAMSGTGAITGVSAITTSDLRVNDDIYAVHLMAATSELNATSSTTNVVSGHSHLNQTYTTGLVDSGTANLNATRVTSLVASGSSNLNTTTISTGDTLVVTDADGLTVGGKKVPTEIPLVNILLNNQTKNGTIFNSDRAFKITKIVETHAAAAATFANCTLYVMKVTGTNPVTSGTYMTNVSINLMGTPETMQTARLSGVAANLTLADGNRIGIVINNRLNDKVTSLAGGSLTVYGYPV